MFLKRFLGHLPYYTLLTLRFDPSHPIWSLSPLPPPFPQIPLGVISEDMAQCKLIIQAGVALNKVFFPPFFLFIGRGVGQWCMPFNAQDTFGFTLRN